MRPDQWHPFQSEVVLPVNNRRNRRIPDGGVMEFQIFTRRRSTTLQVSAPVPDLFRPCIFPVSVLFFMSNDRSTGEPKAKPPGVSEAGRLLLPLHSSATVVTHFTMSKSVDGAYVQLGYKSKRYRAQDRITQMIGRMVRQILEPRGYRIDRQNARIPAPTNIVASGTRYIANGGKPA